MLIGFLSRFALQIAIGLAVTAALGGLYFKMRHDILVVERAKVEQEKQDAIDRGQKARDFIRNRCAVDPANCVSDEWFRD